MIVYIGWADEESQSFVRRYADSVGRKYKHVLLTTSFWKSASTVKKASMVFIWNGMQHCGPLAIELCRRHHIPYCCFEWGWAPQKDTYLLDPCGMGKHSVLMEDLSWVTPDDVAAIQKERVKLQAQWPLKPGGGVVVPLQIENDTSILYTTPYASMDEFIQDIGIMYPSQPVTIRPHPKSTTVRRSKNAKHVVDGSGDFLGLAATASVVVGLTSTTLLESALLGVPTFALGDCPMRHHGRRATDRLLAGYWALRVHRSGEAGPILERFGLKPI